MTHARYRVAVLGCLAAAAVVVRGIGSRPGARPTHWSSSSMGAAKRGEPRLVDVHGGTCCLPCRMTAAAAARLEREVAGRLNVVNLDGWHDRAVAEGYRIRVIPTQLFFDAEGREFYRHEGYLPTEDMRMAFRRKGYLVGPGSRTDAK